jgi:hypothetical protein
VFSPKTALARVAGWKAVEGKLIDRVFVRRRTYLPDRGSTRTIKTYDYMVELTDRDGELKRLVIRARASDLAGSVHVGSVVPVLVNRRGTSAVFDLSDPRIDPLAASKPSRSQREEQRRRDRERFEANKRER